MILLTQSIDKVLVNCRIAIRINCSVISLLIRSCIFRANGIVRPANNIFTKQQMRIYFTCISSSFPERIRNSVDIIKYLLLYLIHHFHYIVNIKHIFSSARHINMSHVNISYKLRAHYCFVRLFHITDVHSP